MAYTPGPAPENKKDDAEASSPFENRPAVLMRPDHPKASGEGPLEPYFGSRILSEARRGVKP